MTRLSRFAAPLTAAALAVFAAAGCTSTGSGMGTTGMGPSAPAANRTGTAGSAGAADARVGAPGERSKEFGVPGTSMGGPNGARGTYGSDSAGGSVRPNGPDAPGGDASGTPGMTAQPPVAQADDETLRACTTYRQMMAGKTPQEQQATWNAHLARVHGITDPQEAAMHQRDVERTCAQVMPGGMR